MLSVWSKLKLFGFCTFENSRLSHSFVTFLGRDPAPDLQIRFSSDNGKQMLLLFEKQDRKGKRAIHSVSQHFALEIFQFRDTLHRQEEKWTKMKRNLNRSYLLHRRRRFQLIVQYNSAFINGMGHANGKRNAWTWKWLVCNISWAVVCTGLSDKYIMYKASNITYSSETPVQYENWVSKACFKKRGIFSIFFQERRP